MLSAYSAARTGDQSDLTIVSKILCCHQILLILYLVWRILCSCPPESLAVSLKDWSLISVSPRSYVLGRSAGLFKFHRTRLGDLNLEFACLSAFEYRLALLNKGFECFPGIFARARSSMALRFQVNVLL